MGYSFTAEWIKRRYQSCSGCTVKESLHRPITRRATVGTRCLAATTVKIRTIVGGPHLKDLRKAAESDREYKQLYVHNGFPGNRQSLPDTCRMYWHIETQISLDNNLIIYGYHIQVPAALHNCIVHIKGRSGQSKEPDSVCTGLASIMT